MGTKLRVDFLGVCNVCRAFFRTALVTKRGSEFQGISASSRTSAHDRLLTLAPRTDCCLTVAARFGNGRPLPYGRGSVQKNRRTANQLHQRRDADLRRPTHAFTRDTNRLKPGGVEMSSASPSDTKSENSNSCSQSQVNKVDSGQYQRQRPAVPHPHPPPGQHRDQCPPLPDSHERTISAGNSEKELFSLA